MPEAAVRVNMAVDHKQVPLVPVEEAIALHRQNGYKPDVMKRESLSG